MSSAEIYAMVSPSIPFIETPTTMASGVLVQGGYVVTNYHVVWPYEAARVVFPGGTELLNVPVVGWDPMADLAVLGPVDVFLPPLKLEDGEDSAPGSEVFLVGYPGEVDRFPEPSITRGILSRFREWERLGMTYLQTDAAIAGGQSGGALVNSRGEVIGISGFGFSEARFGLAASSADIEPIVEQLIQGQHTSELGDRRLPDGPGAFDFDVQLDNFWDTSVFILNGTEGTILQTEFDGPGEGKLLVTGPLGLLMEVFDSYQGVQYGSAEMPVDGVYFVLVEKFVGVEVVSGDSSAFGLSSNIRLQPFHDPDDGKTIAPGQAIAANLDHAEDYDWYSIRLNEGETVRISADSLLTDTVLLVGFPGSLSSQFVVVDDSGGGLWGTNSELVYRAPMTGEYVIAVADATESGNIGGYYLSVEPARAGTETVYVPSASQAVESTYGRMRQFEGLRGSYQVTVPDWVEGDIDPSDGEALWAVEQDENGGVTIVEEDISSYGLSLEEYADLVESEVLVPQGAEVLFRKAVQTSQGVPCVVFEYSFPEDGYSGYRLVCLPNDGVTISVTYVFAGEETEDYLDLVNYSFRSLEIK